MVLGWPLNVLLSRHHLSFPGLHLLPTRHPRGLLVTVNAFRLERDEGLSSLLNSVAMTLG